MPKYLIVNADDYGMCHAANEAVAELFEGGWLKSATVMMPCPTAKRMGQIPLETSHKRQNSSRRRRLYVA